MMTVRHLKRNGICAAVVLACAAAAGAPATLADTGADAAAGNFATTQSPSDWRSTKLVGTNVYNAANESIGEIKDLIIGTTGSVSSAVIGVGGFLGIGEKDVAVPFNTLKVARDEDGNVKISVDATKESLKAAPAFTYAKS